MWPGRIAALSGDLGARAQERDDVGGDVACDVLASGVELRVALPGQADVAARDDPDPQRRRVRRAAAGARSEFAALTCR